MAATLDNNPDEALAVATEGFCKRLSRVPEVDARTGLRGIVREALTYNRPYPAVQRVVLSLMGDEARVTGEVRIKSGSTQHEIGNFSVMLKRQDKGKWLVSGLTVGSPPTPPTRTDGITP